MATLDNLVPPRANLGGAAFTLTCVGSGFAEGDIIAFNNSDEPTIFVSPQQLTTQVKAFMATVAGDFPVMVKAASGDTAAVSFSFLPVDASNGSLLLQQLTNVLTADGTKEALRQASDDQIRTIRR